MDWVKEEMRNTYADLLKDSENSELEAVIGVPHREILRKARAENVDLIVMGAHTRDEDIGASRYRNVVGSTMQKVAKSARCPVVIISRPCTTCWKLFSNIVVGTDFSKPATSSFLWAARLAREVSARLHIFHAVDISASETARIKGQAEIEERIQEARKKIEAKYLSQLDGFDNYEVGIREGTPYVEILKFAREKQGRPDRHGPPHPARSIRSWPCWAPPWSRWCCAPPARSPASTIRTRRKKKPPENRQCVNFMRPPAKPESDSPAATILIVDDAMDMRVFISRCSGPADTGP